MSTAPSALTAQPETYLLTYRIVYRTDEAGVCVLTVFESSRLLRRSDIDEL